MVVQVNQDIWALGTMTTCGKHCTWTENMRESQVSVPIRIPDGAMCKLWSPCAVQKDKHRTSGNGELEEVEENLSRIQHLTGESPSCQNFTECTQCAVSEMNTLPGRTGMDHCWLSHSYPAQRQEHTLRTASISDFLTVEEHPGAPSFLVVSTLTVVSRIQI